MASPKSRDNKVTIDESDKKEVTKAKILLNQLNSKEEMGAWFKVFFDLDFPSGTIYPTSTHGPLDAMWEIYDLFKSGRSAEVSEAVMLGSRDSYKTLAAAAIETLALLHFRFSVAHGAAIKAQSLKAVQYINTFFRKINKYLIYNGWEKISDSKTRIEWVTEKDESIYITVLVATLAGMNCISPESFITMADGSVKPAKHIKPGDMLKTFNYWKDRYTTVKVGHVGYTEKRSRELSFSNGSSLIVSDDHQIFTQKGWILSEKIRPSFKCISDSNIDTDTGECIDDMSSPTRVINTGKVNNNLIYNGFAWSSLEDKESKQGRDFLKSIKKRLNISVDSVRVLNNQRLIDIHIDTDNEHEKSFFANGILVHNSEHVPLLCVPEKSKIRTIFNGAKRTRTASAIVKMYNNGDDIKIASVHPDGFVEYQPLLRADKTESSKVIVSMKYTPKDPRNVDIPVEASFGPKHPVYVINKGGYVAASKLVEGDKVLYFMQVRGGKNKVNRLAVVRKTHIMKRKTMDICVVCGSKFRRCNIPLHSITCKKSICILVRAQKIFYATVTGIKRTRKKETMYDFTVLKNHNFICDNVLVKNCLDEIDLIQDPKVLDEATMVPCTYGQYYPLTVYLSTRKFAGGIMEKTIKNVQKSGGAILRWNILDVTENIPADVARVNEPKVLRYVSKELPLENISPKAYHKLVDADKKRFEPFKAYAGIAEHPLLSAMRNFLVDRPETDNGVLWKSVIAVRNNFKKTPTEMAEAQLLCNAPSSSNLVYSRFSEVLNTLTLKRAYEKIMGETPEIVSFDLLIYEIKNLGLPIYGGADWGFTDYTAFTVFTTLPCGSVILLWHERERGMELSDIVEKAQQLENAFNITNWYPDQNYPAYIKTLKKKTKAKWKKFVKDVPAGISALQTKIVDASASRKFFVLKIAENEPVTEAFGEYKWATDGKGEIIDGKPYHDKAGVSDTMDSIRYPMQVLFGGRKGSVYGAAGSNTNISNDLNREIMREKIRSLTGEVAIGEEFKDAKKIIIS